MFVDVEMHNGVSYENRSLLEENTAVFVDVNGNSFFSKDEVVKILVSLSTASLSLVTSLITNHFKEKKRITLHIVANGVVEKMSIEGLTEKQARSLLEEVLMRGNEK